MLSDFFLWDSRKSLVVFSKMCFMLFSTSLRIFELLHKIEILHAVVWENVRSSCEHLDIVLLMSSRS